MKEKVLVCVLCQTRAYPATWDLFKERVLDTLDADLALCIGLPENYNYDNPFWQNSKYKWTSQEYEDHGDGFDLAQRTDFPGVNIDWRSLIKSLDDGWLGGIRDKNGRMVICSGAVSIYYRWLLWSHIKKENIFDQYDRIVVTRSDAIWLSPHPPMEVLDKNYVWIPNEERHGGVCDRHVILSKDNAEPYLNIIAPIVSSDPETFYREMMNYDSRVYNVERFIKFMIARKLGEDAIKFFPHVMYHIRLEGESTRWSAGEYDRKRGYYIKYSQELASAEKYAGLIRSSEDWIEWSKGNIL